MGRVNYPFNHVDLVMNNILAAQQNRWIIETFSYQHEPMHPNVITCSQNSNHRFDVFL